jgi:hypothetical protein
MKQALQHIRAYFLRLTPLFIYFLCRIFVWSGSYFPAFLNYLKKNNFYLPLFALPVVNMLKRI